MSVYHGCFSSWLLIACKKGERPKVERSLNCIPLACVAFLSVVAMDYNLSQLKIVCVQCMYFKTLETENGFGSLIVPVSVHFLV